MMGAEAATERGNKLFVVELDMENRSAVEIARDAAGKIGGIIDNLIASGYGSQIEMEQSRER